MVVTLTVFICTMNMLGKIMCDERLSTRTFECDKIRAVKSNVKINI